MLALARAVLGLAAFIAVGSALLLLIVRPGSGEFVITVTSLGLGLVLGAIAVSLVRMDGRRTFHQEDQ